MWELTIAYFLLLSMILSERTAEQHSLPRWFDSKISSPSIVDDGDVLAKADYLP